MRLSIVGRVVALAVASAVGFLVMLSIALAQSAATTAAVQRMDQASTGLDEQWNVDMMHDAIRADALGALAAGRDRSLRDRYEVDSVTEHAQEMLVHLDAAAGDAPAQLTQTYATARENVLQYGELAQRLVHAAGRDPQAAAALMPALMRLFGLLEQDLGALNDARHQLVSDTAAAAQREIETAKRWQAAVTAVCLALFVGMAVLLVQAIRRPLRAMMEALSRVADRHLDVQVPAGHDEIGQMGAALARALDAIREFLRAAGEGVASLSQAGSDMEQVSSDLGRSAGQTAGEVEAVSRSVREVTGATTAMSTATGEMDSAIREISIRAGEAAEIVAEAKRTAASSAEAIAKMTTASQEIGNIVESITRIAQQTNLLALNATIEAARAGAAGRGFAVVAGEVKDLALETARATEDVTSRIVAIQSITSEAVETIDGIGRVIERISENQATIASAVEEQSATTSEMNLSVAALSSSAEQIEARLDAIVTSTGTIATGADSTHLAAEDLSGVVSRVTGLVGQFRY